LESGILLHVKDLRVKTNQSSVDAICPSIPNQDFACCAAKGPSLLLIDLKCV
jgi:hypothetical protein